MDTHHFIGSGRSATHRIGKIFVFSLVTTLGLAVSQVRLGRQQPIKEGTEVISARKSKSRLADQIDTDQRFSPAVSARNYKRSRYLGSTKG